MAHASLSVPLTLTSGAPTAALPLARRVLVIQTDPLIGSLLSYLLLERGLDSRVVTTVAQTSEAIRSWRPDLLLIDVPRLGTEAWTSLVQHRQDSMANIPAIALVADSYPAFHAQALDATVLSKPFNLDDLEVHLQRLTGD
jgi:DNA-binding response OmpR family regulator